MKRDFSSLSPQEALYIAIFIEQRNADIYTQFAELFSSFNEPESCEIAATFWDMSQEERKHGSKLQQRYNDRYGQEPCSIAEDDIRDTIEVPNFGDGSIFAIARAQVSRVPRNQALEIALAAETSALKFYTRLSEMTDDRELQQLYEELAEDEGDHSRALRRRIKLGVRAADNAAAREG